VADNPPTPAGNQDPNVTIRKEILDQDVPDLEVISPDSPGADQSQIENALSQPSNTPKENKVSSQTVSREKPKEIKIPLALRRLF